MKNIDKACNFALSEAVVASENKSNMLATLPKVNSPLIATVVGVIAYVIVAAIIVYILYLLLQTVIHHK